MAFKLVVFACLVAVARGNVAVAGPPRAQLVEYDNPSYKFGYNVEDSITGDFKTQEESREGDVVQGRYSLLESDGTRRVVEYISDYTGFHAFVRNELPEAVIGEPVARFAPRPVVAEPVVAKPALARYATVAEPVVTARYAAPAPAVYAAAPARFAAPVAEFAAPGPFARYATGPVPAYRAAYPAPVAAAYATPAVASAYEYTINAGPAAYTAGPVAARFAPAPAVYAAPAPARFAAFAKPVARVAPANIVASAPAEGYRYP